MNTGATDAPDQVLARHGRSFHWARRLFGRREAGLATRLYAFCRTLDDIADGDLPDAEAVQRLSQVRAGLLSLQATDPCMPDFLKVMTECQIDPCIPVWLLDTLAQDRGLPCLASRADLLRYCHGAAGTVGLMMAQILGCRSPQGLHHAVDLGIAMQITNICRDVIEDAQRGRRYLPASMVGELPPACFEKLPATDRGPVRQCLRELLVEADRYYASGLEGLCYLPWRARLGVAVAAFVYRGIGQELARRGHDAWRGRARVGTAGKLRLTLTAIGFVTLRALQGWASRGHDPLLHLPLQGLPGTEQVHDPGLAGVR
jgi:15-cis-phytoene synthase